MSGLARSVRFYYYLKNAQYSSDEGRALFLQEHAISLLVQTLGFTEGRKHSAYLLACVAEKSNFQHQACHGCLADNTRSPGPSHRKEIVSHSTVIPTLLNMLDNAVELGAATEALRWLVQEGQSSFSWDLTVAEKICLEMEDANKSSMPMPRKLWCRS